MRELVAKPRRRTMSLGAAAAAAGLDALFLLGPHAEAVRAGAETAGLDGARIVVATTHAELASHLRAYCRPGDLLLLKGSRGAAMEEVLRNLAADARTETTPVMLYLLLYPLHLAYPPLNVFRYITFRTLLAGLTALFALSPPSGRPSSAPRRAPDRPVDP